MHSPPQAWFRTCILLLILALLLPAWGTRPLHASSVSLSDSRRQAHSERLEGVPAAAAQSTWAHAPDSQDLPEALGSKIDPGLLKRLIEDDPGKQHRIILELSDQTDLTSLPASLSRRTRTGLVVDALQETAGKTQAHLIDFLETRVSEGRVQQLRSFWVFNGLAFTADRDTVLAVAARPEVGRVREDRWRSWVSSLPSLTDAGSSESTIQWNIARVQADQAWSALGLDGKGVTIAIMDTGVDWQHPAIKEQYRGYRPGGQNIHEGNWICTTDEGYLYPVDGHGHGTHVTGIAVGSQDADGVSIGVAPGANWIGAKALSDSGYGYDSWIHAAFEWILAPGGDPALAPDILNGSWGSALGADEAFREDMQSIRAAGILPVFSAGNRGPGAQTLESPGSYPEAIAVGATDDIDRVTSFSSRGPSYWGEIKPEVSAPGAQIRSSLPGASYGTMSGTSMAAPHVAGLGALVLQADPTLSVDDVEAVIASTALPLAEQVPNNDTGWGRIDAYKAAAVALQAGYVDGQVTRQSDLQPLPYALVTAFDHDSQPLASVAVDELGYYRLALPEGQYRIEASAFGHEPDRVQDVLVAEGESVTLDFQLDAAPSGTLHGHITETESGLTVSAQISVPGTPVLAISDPQTGEYSLPLPGGVYTVTVSQNGYRRATASNLEIVVDGTTSADFALVPAPTLLLVDSGRWYYGSQARFFQSALDDGDYVYDLWEVRSPDTDTPEETDLAPFSITIWSAPSDSPGLIGAGDVISGYLTSGGNLLLSGQDVGFWDSGASGWFWEDYYPDLLKAQLIADNAGRDDVLGVPGDLLDGLTLPINGPESAGNQTTPDLIDVLEPLDASLIGLYRDVGGAALRSSGCQSYHAVYLASGLEGLGDGETRAEVMDRAITWLDSPHPSIETRLTPPHQETVWLSGSYITYTVELQNRGQSSDRFDLELSASDWSAEVMDSSFTQAITQSVVLSPCQSQILGVKVAIAPDAGWNATDVVTLTARSQADPVVSAQAAFATKTPAPILLVDDHRWYDTSARYRMALEARHLPYDLWRNPQTPTADFGSPSLERLARYPVVVWFTAYDWYNTLTPTEEARLATYLDGGGRLLFSSQDYLYTSGLTGLATDYFGVLSNTEDYSVTQTVGAVGHPVGDGRAAMDLVYPFRNFSDALRPSPEAQVAFWGQHGQPVALTVEDAAWKTAFYAFALEAFDPTDMAEVMGDTVDWLSPLGDSTLTVDSPVVHAGEKLIYTLSIRNTGPRPLANATLSNPLPPSTIFVPGSLQGPAAYDPRARSITWSGRLDPGEMVTAIYQLQVGHQLRDGAVIENVIHLDDETGLGLERIAITRVESPYLGGSAQIVSADVSPPGRVLTYTLALQNDGLQPADARLTDPIPANSYHVPGSGWASSGVLTSTGQLLVWSGTLGAGDAVTITFPVHISPTIKGFYVYNRATLTDDWGDSAPLEARTLVESRLYLPLILRGF